ncbi:MAG: hypothetical protein WKF58_20450 [Ilumatobacteraceae bacterium]
MSGIDRVELSPLSDSDVRLLVRSLHPERLRESDMHTVVERAEGNAFFVEELVAAAASGGGALPRDLAGLLLVRLDQLDEGARQVVRVASAAGRDIPHEVLAEVAGMDGAALEQGLRDAVERHVLVPAGPDSYAFRHAMLGEAAYDDLLPGERVRLHADFVRALATRRCRHCGGAGPARSPRPRSGNCTAGECPCWRRGCLGRGTRRGAGALPHGARALGRRCHSRSSR